MGDEIFQGNGERKTRRFLKINDDKPLISQFKGYDELI